MQCETRSRAVRSVVQYGAHTMQSKGSAVSAKVARQMSGMTVPWPKICVPSWQESEARAGGPTVV